MKVYVDRLPANCDECPMCRCGSIKLNRKGRYIDAHECVFGQYKYQGIDYDIDTCPLKTIQSVQNEKVVEALENLKKELDLIPTFKSNNATGVYINLLTVLEKTEKLIKEYGGEDDVYNT